MWYFGDCNLKDFRINVIGKEKENTNGQMWAVKFMRG